MLHLTVPLYLNIPKWHRCLRDYPANLCVAGRLGIPAAQPVQSNQNHGSSARSNPTVIHKHLSSECELSATCGPFVTNPLSVNISVSPLQIAYSRTGKPSVVIDPSYPPGKSVNCGIPCDTYFSEPFSIRLGCFA